MSDELRKILIPMIRKVLPAVIANDLVRVQPMQDLGWRTGEGKGQMHDLEYWIQAPQGAGDIFEISLSHRVQKRNPDIAIMQIWCEETFGMEYATGWYKQGSAFYFVRETDRTAFALRWIS